MHSHDAFLDMALDEAAISRHEGNDGYGAVVVQAGSVVARGRNITKTSGDPTNHAELVALREAAGKLGAEELHGSTLYASFDPCPMCLGAILVSGIATLVVAKRRDLANSPWGDYTTEGLLHLTKRAENLTVVRPDSG